MNRQCIATLPTLLLVASTTSGAATLRVPADYPTIQAAVDAADGSRGDEVVIAPGYYTEPEIRIPEQRAGVTLRSECGDPSCVVLGGENSDWAIASITGATIDGITFVRSSKHAIVAYPSGRPSVIRNCAFVSNRLGVWAKGPAIGRGESVTLVDCVFTDSGTALKASDSWNAITVERCRFLGNHGGTVVGLHASGANVVRDCLFEDNRAPALRSGEPLFGGAKTLVIERTNFARNLSRGAPTAWVEGLEWTVEDCRFFDNESDRYPGALGVVGAGDGTVRRSLFLNNRSTMGPGAVGLRVEEGGTITLDECVLAGNASKILFPPFSTGAVGGWTTGGTDLPFRGAIDIADCTFDSNDGLAAGHIALPTGPQLGVNIANSLLVGSTGGPTVRFTGTQPPRFRCTDIHGNEGGDWLGDWADQLGRDGNVSVDPAFCSTDRLRSENWMLSDDSPLLGGECGRIGARSAGCGTTAIRAAGWAAIKALYR